MTQEKKRSTNASKDVEMSTEGQTNEERGNWGGQLEFILTCVGYSVGLGNIWRFPYLAYKNGGGAFLIPYWIMMIFVGLPLFYMELSLGQFSSEGPLTVWKLNPLFKGVGMAMVVVSGVIAFYYNVIIAYCLYFLLLSMRTTPAWLCCGNWWNTPQCIDRCSPDNSTASNMTTPAVTLSTTTLSANSTPKEEIRTASEEFFENFVLRLSGSVETPGELQWQIAVLLLLAWVIVFLVLVKGIQSLGKVVYFTALFPYVLLTALLIRGVLETGARDGIVYYLNPVWSRLKDGQVWSDACTQLFFSLGIGQGGLLTMASYNKFKNNALRDAMIVPLVDCFTSFYSGLVIFSVLGVMAHENNQEVSQVAREGPGLTFVVYPEALTKMPAPTVWACLFFFMMCIIGFSSQFSIIETVISACMDLFPVIRNHSLKFRFIIAVVWFLLALPMVTQGGYYILDIVNNFIGGYPLLIIAILEVVCVQYIYGYSKYAEDIKMMLGKKPSIFFRATWCVILPLILLAVIVFKAATDDPNLSGWPLSLGWMICAAPIVCIPGWFIFYCCKHQGWELFLKLSAPTDKWGPALEVNRTGRYEKRGSVWMENLPPNFDNLASENLPQKFDNSASKNPSRNYENLPHNFDNMAFEETETENSKL